MDGAVPEVEEPSGRPILTLLWIALFVAAFAPTAMWLWSRWTISIWYSGHGIFMPFILAYLLWERLHEDPVSGSHSSAWGFVFLFTGLAMLALDAAIQTDLLAAAGLVVCLPGLSLLVLGGDRTRGLVFALVIAAFMLPIPAGFVTKIHLFLREITAFGTSYVVPLLDIPLSKNGTVLNVPGHSVSVADACSGFSTMYAAVTTGLILSHLNPSKSRGLLLIATSVVLAIICNIIRVSFLVLVVYYGHADLLETSLHEGSGIVSFAVVIAILFWMSGRETFRGPEPERSE